LSSFKILNTQRLFTTGFEFKFFGIEVVGESGMKGLRSVLWILPVVALFGPKAYSQITQSQCVLFDYSFDEVGYTMTDKTIEQLTKNMWLPTTKSLKNEDILNRIESFIKSHNASADISLSSHILKIAHATGIDPFVFTSLIKAESTFKMDAKSHTGALGLTQMTRAAFKELRNQLGLGDRKFNPRARDSLNKMIQSYYEDPRGTQRFIDFISSTKNSKNNELVLKDVSFSLLSGALLFKIKLAITKGDYRKALEAYNGSKDKASYARGILNSTQNGFSQVTFKCMSIEFSNPIIGDSCELSRDSSFCHRYLGIISI
jgi:hypothetical protein